MVSNNLYFFDKNGESLSLQINPDSGAWEGTVYFDQLSVALFDNENLFILEIVTEFPSIVLKTDKVNIKIDNIVKNNHTLTTFELLIISPSFVAPETKKVAARINNKIAFN